MVTDQSSTTTTTTTTTTKPSRGDTPVAFLSDSNGSGRDTRASTSPAPKRPHKRTYQATMNGPKMQHLKKKDGEALWREDIQYDFLHAVFTDATPAFTSQSNAGGKGTFADIYLNAMAQSTKCSKILSEKLLGDRQAGIKIAMVCLLVNLGRMNTTLNFFPEMKTQLRTYHPIPSLQTHDTQDYKQLQDAPRLKSILKGACEGSDEATTLNMVRQSTKRPRTNPISLIFLMSTWANEVKQEMFPNPPVLSYFDLILDTTKTSLSRARAFLWLIWEYTESPQIGSSVDNPFGSSFPFPEPLDEQNARTENVDSPAELVFGNQMTLQRLAILNNYSSAESDPNLNSNDTAPDPADKNIQSASSLAPSGSHTNDKSPAPLAIPKTRMRSAKDRRVNEEFIGLVRTKRESRKILRYNRNNAVKDLWRFIEDLDPIYDSDDDIAQAKRNGKSHGVRAGVLASGLQSRYADYGERCMSQAVSLKRIARRLSPQEGTIKKEEV